ncbi:MAG TPA: lysylphosphatidylglycerol synthase domain-containing protein [Candidatus Saccharimonadales bacterium]|nr:lysylphosphatidylglycerol synthase domain-containing protein [Candidatus Saccharimonadales bacterium]
MHPKQRKHPSTPRPHHAVVRTALTIAILALAAYVLRHNWHIVSQSLQAARGASIPWLAVSVGFMAGTFMIAASIYGVLALHTLHFPQTALVEVSTAFVNRLLPSGIGGLGLHGLYLYRQKHTAAEATAVVSVNNLMGMVAHGFLLLVVALFQADEFSQLAARENDWFHPWQLAVLIGLVVGVALVSSVRHRLRSFAANLFQSVVRIRLAALAGAFVLAVLLTITYTTILWCSARAVGIDLSLVQIFIVFSIGMLASTATPAPGGLVGAEAGLFAGFVVYGIAAAPAGAAVLLYRLVTYWLPLVPGVLALSAARARKLV